MAGGFVTGPLGDLSGTPLKRWGDDSRSARGPPVCVGACEQAGTGRHASVRVHGSPRPGRLFLSLTAFAAGCGDARPRLQSRVVLQAAPRLRGVTTLREVGSSAEPVGAFGFGFVSTRMRMGDFQRFTGKKPACCSGSHADLFIGLPRPCRLWESSPGSEPAQDQVAARAHDADRILHQERGDDTRRTLAHPRDAAP